MLSRRRRSDAGFALRKVHTHPTLVRRVVFAFFSSLTFSPLAPLPALDRLSLDSHSHQHGQAMPPLARPVSSADLRSHNGNLPVAPAPEGQGHAGRGLSLKVGVERNAYVAGQQIKGVLELSVRDKRIALGDIGVEFTAHERESGSLWNLADD